MTKFRIKTLKLNEPMMLFWSLIPLLVLVVATNYIFNSDTQVLGTATEDLTTQQTVDPKLFDGIKARNNEFKLNRNGVVTILFVGAYKSQFEVGYPIIKSNNMVASVSVPSAEINEIKSKMTWLNLQLLQHQDWEILSQSKDQICDINKLKQEDVVISETVGSKETLTNHNLYVNAYLAPCGINTPELMTEVRSNYNAFVNFGILYNSLPATNKYNLVTRTASNDVDIEEVIGWINDANIRRQWLILAIPEVSENNDNFSISEKYLETIINEISQSKNQVATIGDILKY